MKHWSQFWNASNTISSFAEGEAATGYTADVNAFWEKSVDGLAKDAVIVDIGTGNGALAVLLNDLRKKQKTAWEIHGVDAAEISPAKLEERAPEFKGRFDGIQFHANTDMASMPFADASVDLVVSQFAFEYGEQSAVLKEVLRVLKPGGRLVMMSHHKKSSVHKSTELGIEILKDIVTGSPLFIQTDLYLRLTADALQHISLADFQKTQEAQAAGKTIEWILEQFRAKYSKDEQKAWVADVGRRVLDIINAAQSSQQATELQRQLFIQHNLLTGHIQRLEDMTQAASTEAQVKKLISAAKKAGADGDFESFDVEGEVFAWTVGLQKAS